MSATQIPVSTPLTCAPANSTPSASRARRTTSPSTPSPTGPQYTTSAPTWRTACKTLKPPPGVRAKPLAKTSAPGAGTAGTLIVTSTTT